MDSKIKTSLTLSNLVEIDTKNHELKDISILFLNAMNDWNTYNQTDIFGFIEELKEYFGSPLTIAKINEKKFNSQNAWQIEAGISIAELIDSSTKFYKQTDFDKIIVSILNYYNEVYDKVDFIAELKYFTTEQGGRKTPAKSGYRAQLKFDFTEMQSSGKQTFIDQKTVFPGENVEAKIKILSPECFTNCLTKGMDFEFREGDKIIGIGQIKYIVNDKLQKVNN